MKKINICYNPLNLHLKGYIQNNNSQKINLIYSTAIALFFNT